ncbi:MAG: signal peptidase II [Xanthomonadaceae bacterium]|nr:signal peptidase II [Rhodospirillaceae bacterium]NIA18237.1 signal peptidase II [Xanthomonadaceae bacterium]
MNKVKIILINIIGIIIIFIDQITKRFILKNPDIFRGFSIGNFLHITLSKNYNLAFGINISHSILYLLIGLIILFLFNLLKKNYFSNDLTKVLIITIILSGAISNLIDRIFLGYVVDFINISWFSIFNFADICIVLGIVFFIKIELFKKTG